MRPGLKGTEEFVGLRHAGAGIAEMDRDQVAFHGHGDAHFANRAALQRLLAVARQVDEDLHQAVMVGLHQRQGLTHFPDQRDAGVAQSRLDHDARFVEHGAEVGDHGLPVRGGAQAGGRDLLQPVDQSAQHLVLIVALHRAFGGQAGVGRRGGRSQIADLMGDGAHQDARRGHHRIEARALAIAQAFAGIPDDGGQPRTLRGAVGGEPYVGQKDLAVAALRLAFHIGAQVDGGARALQHAVQNRQVGRHVRALQRFVFKAEQLARRFVGQGDPAGVIQREDGQRAGLDQDPHLLLRLLPQADLPLAFRQMVRQIAPALVQRSHEEAGHGEARDDDGEAFGRTRGRTLEGRRLRGGSRRAPPSAESARC